MTRDQIRTDLESRLKGIHDAIRAAKADGIDRTDPHRFEFMARSYWLLSRSIADHGYDD